MYTPSIKTSKFDDLTILEILLKLEMKKLKKKNQTDKTSLALILLLGRSLKSNVFYVENIFWKCQLFQVSLKTCAYTLLFKHFSFCPLFTPRPVAEGGLKQLQDFLCS